MRDNESPSCSIGPGVSRETGIYFVSLENGSGWSLFDKRSETPSAERSTKACAKPTASSPIRSWMQTTGPRPRTTNCEAVRDLVGELARTRGPAPRAVTKPQRASGLIPGRAHWRHGGITSEACIGICTRMGRIDRLSLDLSPPLTLGAIRLSAQTLA
jgi:hypothetical protein